MACLVGGQLLGIYLIYPSFGGYRLGCDGVVAGEHHAVDRLPPECSDGLGRLRTQFIADADDPSRVPVDLDDDNAHSLAGHSLGLLTEGGWANPSRTAQPDGSPTDPAGDSLARVLNHFVCHGPVRCSRGDCLCQWVC